MPAPALNTSNDFLFPKLHGRWATALVGHRLEDMIRGGSLQILGRYLSTLGIGIQDRAAVQKNLTLFLISELGWISGLVDDQMAPFYSRQLERYHLENLKTLLRHRYQGGDLKELAYLLVESEYLPALPWERMVQARTVHEFYGLMPRNAYRDDFLPILVEVEATKDIFAADAGIDRLHYARFLGSANQLRRSRRELAVTLIGTEIDATNMITAMRNMSVYRFGPEELRPLLLPGGRLVDIDAAVDLGTCPRMDAFWSALPKEYAVATRPFRNAEPYRVENALWTAVYELAREAFKDYGRPALSAVAYPFLKRFEVLNLGRLFEGLYLKLDAALIRSMMIGL